MNGVSTRATQSRPPPSPAVNTALDCYERHWNFFFQIYINITSIELVIGFVRRCRKIITFDMYIFISYDLHIYVFLSRTYRYWFWKTNLAEKIRRSLKCTCVATKSVTNRSSKRCPARTVVLQNRVRTCSILRIERCADA